MNMKKNAFTRIIYICVIVFLIGSLLLPIASASFSPPTGNIPYEDVPRGRWDHEYVSWAWVNNITTGTSQTAFSPTRNVTRGEFVTFLYRIAGEPAVGGRHNFRDVPADRFFSTPVLWAWDNSVTTGTSPTTFDPTAYITREQLATMLYRNFANGEIAPSVPPGRYGDNATVSAFARVAVNWAVRHEVMGVNTNSLNPRGNATRSEAMAMIRRVVEKFGVSFNPWSRPFINVPALPTTDIPIPRMVEAAYVADTLSTGTSWVEHEIYINTSGKHWFVLTEFAQVGRRVEIKVNRWSGSAWQDMPGFPSFVPIGLREEGPSLDLPVGRYQVQVRQNLGSSGAFRLGVLRDKLITNISIQYPDFINIIPDVINIKNISDSMEFERQANEYRFQTPATTGTGLPTPGGIYRFDITAVPSAVGVRTIIQLEVLLERGMVPVVGPINLALFEGVNGELRDNETYIIRTTQVPAVGDSSTVMSDVTPYTLRVSAQKNRAIITPMHANAANRISRISVVNDSFQFIGQMNTYEFVAPSDGTFQFRPNLMPARSEFRISDPWGNVQTGIIGVGEGISSNLVANATYRIHVIHQPGSPLGNYSFTIVYP
jgi:hypothetical protein